MIRLWTKSSTGVAPDGAWLAGDINDLQDAVAALEDLTQALQVASVAIGESGLQIVRYGSGEARLSGALRTDSIVRALGGLYAGAFTSTARDAIASGSRPYGLIILNTTTNRLEWNAGSDGSPDWQPLATGAESLVDTLANRPTASSVSSGTTFFATDQVAQFISNGTSWYRISKPAGDVSICLAATADTGYLLLKGQAWPATTGIYADLYARYGNPANVPDFGAFAPVGYKSGDADFGTLLGTVGEKTHALTVPEMPTHTHTYDKPTGANGGYGGATTTPSGIAVGSSTGAAGSGQAHNNIQPSKAVNFQAKL